MKRVFVTGRPSGQLYWELERTTPSNVEWLQWPEALDVCDHTAVRAAIGEMKPDAVINAAAYTAVDKAETEPSAAHALNHGAVENLAEVALEHSVRLIHVSTDFVFGTSDGRPLTTQAPATPTGIYGKSKLRGEQSLQRLLPRQSVIVRTAWLYSSHGNNFVKTMLRLMQERDELGVVADQIGSPTWAYELARALWQAMLLDIDGVLHWSGAGVASWYDFAVAIANQAHSLRLIDKLPEIKPLTSEQYPTAATRPYYSVMALQDSWQRLDLTANHWQTDLRHMLEELRDQTD